MSGPVRLLRRRGGPRPGRGPRGRSARTHSPVARARRRGAGPNRRVGVRTVPVDARVASAGVIDWDARVRAVLADEIPIGVAFQPVIDLKRRTTVGYEALARFGPI